MSKEQTTETTVRHYVQGRYTDAYVEQHEYPAGWHNLFTLGEEPTHARMLEALQHTEHNYNRSLWAEFRVARVTTVSNTTTERVVL